MRNHMMRTKRKWVAEVIGSVSRVPSLNTITFAADAVPGAQAGDLAVLWWYDGDTNGYPTGLSGWTMRWGHFNGVAIYTKELTSSDVSVSFSSGDLDGFANLTIVRGVTFGGFLGTFGDFGDFGSAVPDPPSVTGFLVGDMCLVVEGHNSTTAMPLPYSGYTLRGAPFNATGPGTRGYVFSKTITVAGAENPPSFVTSLGSWAAATIRLSLK